MKPVMIDGFGCQGGAARGYQRAGFYVIGVELEVKHRKRYAGDEFHVGDVFDIVPRLVRQLREDGETIMSHMSPPCQAYTACQRIQGNEHPDLVDDTRAMLEELGLPWVIENVEGAPLRDPLLLCGAMFPELRVYRHRLFESNVPLEAPPHPSHVAPLRKMGRRPAPGDFMHVVGNFSGVAQAREAMGIDWMTRDGLREAIPPAYTEYIGRQLLASLTTEIGAAA